MEMEMKKHKGEMKLGAHYYQEIPYLPMEIIFDILSRVPTLTLVRCKPVCKAWLHLIRSDEFLNSHKPSAGLALKWGQSLKFIDFGNEAGPDYDEHLRNIAFDLDSVLPFSMPLHSSVNGLLLLCEKSVCRSDHIICNPITRDYIRLPSPFTRNDIPFPPWPSDSEIYGFGVSRTSGQYKVVRISFNMTSLILSRLECHVYTVGTGSWRRIGCDIRLKYVPNHVGEFLNGNLHWLVDNGHSTEISCLDLETELFTTFPTPPRCYGSYRTLSVLGDCLCVCDNSDYEHRASDQIYIWSMKEYGDEKSWTEQFVIYKVDRHDFLGYIRPIKAFRDGSILMELLTLERKQLLYYSNETKVIRHAGVSRRGCRMAVWAPSFRTLKTFATERVGTF